MFKSFFTVHYRVFILLDSYRPNLGKYKPVLVLVVPSWESVNKFWFSLSQVGKV